MARKTRGRGALPHRGLVLSSLVKMERQADRNPGLEQARDPSMTSSGLTATRMLYFLISISLPPFLLHLDTTTFVSLSRRSLLPAFCRSCTCNDFLSFQLQITKFSTSTKHLHTSHLELAAKHAAPRPHPTARDATSLAS